MKLRRQQLYFADKAMSSHRVQLLLLKGGLPNIQLYLQLTSQITHYSSSFITACVFVFVQLDEGTPPEPEGSFVDYQTSMVKYSKAIAVTAQEMVIPQKYKSCSSIV